MTELLNMQLEKHFKFGDYNIEIVEYNNLTNDLLRSKLLTASKLASVYLYDGRSSPEVIYNKILNRKGSINIIADYNQEMIGFFQAVPLKDSMYFSLGIVNPKHRKKHLHDLGISLRVLESLKEGYRLCVSRTASPLVVEILNKFNFRPYIPEVMPKKLIMAAEYSVSQYRGHHIPLGEDMIIDGGIIPIIQKSSNATINQFMHDKVNAETGKRLVLIRENNFEKDMPIIERYLAELTNEQI